MANPFENMPLEGLEDFETSRSRNPFISRAHTREKLEEDYHSANILNQRTFFKALVIQKGVRVPLEQLNIKPLRNHGNATDIIVVKAWSPLIHRIGEPNSSFKDDNLSEISVEEIAATNSTMEFVAISSEISEIPDVGDIITVSIEDMSSLTGLYYHSIEESASKNAGAGKKNIKPKSDKTAGLQDTTSPPSDGSVLPTINGNIPQNRQLQNTNPPTPGLYPVHKNSEQPYALYEMVIVPGVSLLYPKRYEKVLEAMRQKYTSDTGKQLGITSAYRDVQKQRALYEAYISGKTKKPVAKPGFSKHNNGLAVDFSTGEEVNNRYFAMFQNNKNISSTAYRRAQNGEFGEVAQWLSNNSAQFGFEWTGYSFGELWHYELNPNKIPANLKGDETGDKLV